MGRRPQKHDIIGIFHHQSRASRPAPLLADRPWAE
jgi:hypothetical protein